MICAAQVSFMILRFQLEDSNYLLPPFKGATLNVPNDPNRINTPEPEQSIRKPYVRTEYHPFSQRADEYTPLDEYFAATPRVHSRDPNVPGAGSSSPPESPFESYPDFSFAEWITCARLSAPEVNSLLGLMKNVWTSGSSNISFNSYQDILKVFDPMDPVTVPVCSHIPLVYS
jgi:hypothetical protein